MQYKTFISVICPIYNEKDYISSCIESILSQDYLDDNMEVLFIDGMSTDNTREVIKCFSDNYHFIKLFDNPGKYVSNALNIGIKASKGQVIIRIDAHCLYPVNYISRLVSELAELNADNVGAMIITNPANSSGKARAISTAMSHPFGVGNSFFRIGCKTIKEVDTVPFGCFNRDVFNKIGLFDKDLLRDQDDEFNSRIKKFGGKIFLIPDIKVTYFARDKISKVRDMFYQYGLFKPLVNKKTGYFATIRQFVPPIFIITVILGTTISLFYKSINILTLFVLLIYLILSICISIIEAFRYKKYNLIIFLPYVFWVIHISYGWGYLMGIFKFLIFDRKRINLNNSR